MKKTAIQTAYIYPEDNKTKQGYIAGQIIDFGELPLIVSDPEETREELRLCFSKIYTSKITVQLIDLSGEYI